MHTIHSESSGQDFKSYLMAGRISGVYARVSSTAQVQAQFVALEGYVVRAAKACFHTSYSGADITTWITKRAEIQRKTVFIASLGVASLALKQALPIMLEVSANSVAAYSYDLDELAVASGESDALDEMRATIAETYRILKAEQAPFGPLQQRHWEFLKQIIAED